MSLWLALVTLGLVLAFVVTAVRKVPDPNHEFMMNLYDRVLGQETERLHTSAEEYARSIDRGRPAA
jgi:hypothetical protein